jgi:hypothetical protein
MATNDKEMRDLEFESAFGEDDSKSKAAPVVDELDDVAEPASAEAGETASDPEGEPASMVIVAEAGPGAEGSGGLSVDPAAVAEAKAVNDEANAAASDTTSEVVTTGQAEAAGNSDAAAAEGSPAEEASETPSVEAMEQGGDEPTDPKDIQRKKSWEGRLKAEEKRLKDLAAQLEAKGSASGEAPAEAGAEALEQVADTTPNAAMAQAAEDVADQVQAGEISLEDGLKQLSEDFGEGFVKLIQAVAADAANKAIGPKLGKLEEDTQGVIDHIRDSADRAHYQAIYDAHPDFMEVSDSPAFKEFVAAKGAEQVVENGSAQEINKLLADFKASGETDHGDTAGGAPAAAAGATPAQDAVVAAKEAAPAIDQGAADAAEGVRSAGLRLPDKPVKANDDFESAWNEY